MDTKPLTNREIESELRSRVLAEFERFLDRRVQDIDLSLSDGLVYFGIFLLESASS